MTRLTSRPSVWIALFAIYFAIQAFLRSMIPAPLNLDEGEAWLWAQQLDFGYGPQPPLYIWIQGLVFALTGPNALGLALLKNVLLFAIFVTTFQIVRRWLTVPLAGLATLALFWLPELGWESQRIRTHNVLAALIALLLALWLIRAVEKGRMGGVVPGLLIGAGLLSKWNFGLVPVAFFGALVMWREGRQAFDRRLWLAVPVAAIMVAPTLFWMWRHPDVAFASVGKLGIDAADGDLPIVAFLQSFAGYAALPLVLILLFRAFSPKRADDALLPQPIPASLRWALLAPALALFLFLVVAVGSGMTQITARWFLPPTILALPALAALVVPRLGAKGTMLWTALSAGFMVVYLVGIPAVLVIDRPAKELSFPDLAAALPPRPGEVIAGDILIVANVGLLRPDLAVTDLSLLRTGGCPDKVTIIDAGFKGETPKLARGFPEWLQSCALAPGPVESFVPGGSSGNAVAGQGLNLVRYTRAP